MRNDINTLNQLYTPDKDMPEVTELQSIQDIETADDDHVYYIPMTGKEKREVLKAIKLLFDSRSGWNFLVTHDRDEICINISERLGGFEQAEGMRKDMKD